MVVVVVVVVVVAVVAVRVTNYTPKALFESW
jgi:hypothetical protein